MIPATAMQLGIYAARYFVYILIQNMLHSVGIYAMWYTT
jgi:hypothetical protein